MTARRPLAGWFAGVDPVTPEAGIGGFEPLIPITEPVSIGDPPLSPDLVDALDTGWAVTRKSVASGQVVTRSAMTECRPKLVLRWTAMSLTQRNLMRDFIDADLPNGVQAFQIYPDGADGDPVKVRAVGAWREIMPAKGVYSIEVDVEEVY